MVKREKIRAVVKQIFEGMPKQNSQNVEQEDSEFPIRVKVNSLKENSNDGFDRDESELNLLTENDLQGLERGKRVRVSGGVKFTAAARDFIEANNIELVYKASRKPELKVASIGLGCDHGGYEYKERLKDYLVSTGVKVRDFGTNSTDSVDYPDFAFAVADAVSSGRVDIGIIIDGAGIGSAMAAGKVSGVRPAACYNIALAKNSREHNGANVLTLGSGQNSFEDVKEIVHAFITTEISEPRHKRRVEKIDAIERQFLKG
ncbi:MAG: RpiB/LacA/LacB family sugar-phosphate isomerase [Pyrinomonadaceae bacterium]